MTTEAESQTKRFYADLSPEQQKVLLKKADHYLCKKLGLPRSKRELTNEKFQQIVHLLATAWKDRNTVLESFGHDGVRIMRDVSTSAVAAAAAATPAAETPAVNKGRRPLKSMSRSLRDHLCPKCSALSAVD